MLWNEKKHSIAYVNKWKPNGSCKNEEEEFDNMVWWNICKSKNWGEWMRNIKAWRKCKKDLKEINMVEVVDLEALVITHIVEWEKGDDANNTKLQG